MRSVLPPVRSAAPTLTNFWAVRRSWGALTPGLCNTKAVTFGRARVLAFIVGCAYGAGCGSEESSPQSCEFAETTRVEFTRVRLVDEFSSSLCPTVDAERLNEELGDAGTKACAVAVKGCSVTVNCDFDLAKGGGTLKYEDDQFTGFLEVRDPIDCSYSVAAKPR